MPSSIGSPVAARKVARTASRGAGTPPSKCDASCSSFFPETRTIPIPALPGAVATAAITSVLDGPAMVASGRYRPARNRAASSVLRRRRGIHLGLNDHGSHHQRWKHVPRIGRRKILDPEIEGGLAQFNAFEEHPVERDEDRNLHEDRQATTQRIDFLGLV